MPTMSACAVFVCAIISWAALSAQPLFENAGDHINFERLTVEQGLSQNTVQCLWQDHRGFIWLGTQDGLNQYDGYGFKVYKPDPGNLQSLSENKIEVIYEDRAGILWIGTQNGGLNQFDPATESFRQYKNDPQNPQSLSNNHVLAIYESRQERDSVLWIGTEVGLNRFDRATETFKHYQYNPENLRSLPHNSVSAICDDTFGELWIGTVGGGLSRMSPQDRAAGTFRSYQHDPQNPQSLLSNVVNAICEDQAGRLWIGTSGGLSCLQREAREAETATGLTFRNYQHVPKDPASLSQDYVRSIYADRSGVIWFGTRGGGLNRFDPATEDSTGAVFRHYRNDPQNATSLSSDDILAIGEDRAGGMWIGTRTGVNRFERAPIPFQHFQHDPNNPQSLSDNSVWAIYEDRSGVVWIGTVSGGLDRLERTTGTFTHFRHDAKNSRSLSDNSVWSIYEDRAGALWIGTREGGLNQFDRATKTFRHFQRDLQNSQSLSHNWVTSIHEDAAVPGVLWIGTWGGGLNRFDRNTELFKNYQSDPKNPQSLSANGVWLVYEDRSGALWLGTEAGLEQFDRATETFKHYQHNPDNPQSLSNNSIWSIYEDHAGGMWIGTRGGLNQFDRRSETFKHYREKDGLPNEVIYGILGDNHGNLWLSTNKGIVKFNPETKRIKHYEARDGVQSNEFNADAAFQNRRGEMFFGGINGFNVFYPDSIKDNPYVPPVVITALKRYSIDVTEGVAISEKGIAARDEIVLSYKDEILTFEFAALSYRNTSKNQYAFKLEGLNENWIQLGTERRVTFTNLSPGSYVLRVRGSNNDGVWNEAGTALQLMITPPWWRTSWAYALYAVLVLGLFYATRRADVNWREQKARIRESELQAETAIAQSRALQAENARQELELQKATELKIAHSALEKAHENLKAAQQQLVTQEKLASLGQLTAGIAHEIKNPLNFVNNFAVLSARLAASLLEKLRAHQDNSGEAAFGKIEADLSKLAQMNQKVAEHGRRADSIVKGMMEHARVSTGQRELADLHALLQQAVDLAHQAMRAQHAAFTVKIECDYDPAVGRLKVVPQNLSRAFLNLLNNAFYAVHQKQTESLRQGGDNFSPGVLLKTRNLGDQVEIRIRDNGNGIPPAVLDKIFNPFFTTKPAGQGAGLGLSISYDIIAQEHKGEIKCESEAGKFAEFVIRLPERG